MLFKRAGCLTASAVGIDALNLTNVKFKRNTDSDTKMGYVILSVLPNADDMPWPDEPFRSRFLVGFTTHVLGVLLLDMPKH